jgi:predicted dehydrogenase
LGTIQIIEGQKLIVHSNGGQREEVITADGRGWTSEPWTQIQDSVPRTQQHFIDVLQGIGTFETSGEDSLHTYALAKAAYRSASSGRLVTTQEL